jgi:hypothetical protein
LWREVYSQRGFASIGNRERHLPNEIRSRFLHKNFEQIIHVDRRWILDFFEQILNLKKNKNLLKARCFYNSFLKKIWNERNND